MSIPGSQGFWVKAISIGILGITNEIREHADQTFLNSTSTSKDLLSLKVIGSVNSLSDELILKFGNTNNLGGAEKMFSIDSRATGMYTTKFNKNWSINLLTTIANHAVISIGFKAGIDGIHTLIISGLSSFTFPTFTY